MKEFGRTASTLAIIAFLAALPCKAESPHYVFVLPEGYVGWIQVIFSSPDAPKIVPKHGRFVLRIDKSGVLKTSSLERVFAFPHSHDEFFYSRLDAKGKEVLSPVPSNYYCSKESGIDSCYGGDGTVSDGFTVGRANLGHPSDGTPGNSWFLFVGPPDLRAKMAKPIHRAPGEKYQIDVPEDDPHPGVDYSGCRSCNTRGVFPAPSSFQRFFGVWSTPGRYFRGGTQTLSNKTIVKYAVALID